VTDRGLPQYRGIRTYRDPGGRFQFRYPSDWHSFELSGDRDGVMYSPEPEGPKTWFAVWSTRLQDKVVAEDVDVLREGVEEGLYQLPDLCVESRSDDVFGNMIRFERIYTFRENGAIRKRKVWMLYVFKWLFALVAQGETAEEYQYWYPMLGGCIDSFDLPPELWFASDRDLGADLR
jgi:hypothetical protein